MIQVHGHEIVVHTQKIAEDRHLCFVFLTDPHNERHELRIFRGRAETGEKAEEATLKAALDYLDRPTPGSADTIMAGRSTLHVAGRKVDVFCDLLPDGRYQAFPFLYRPDGKRVIIMRFHLGESITGRTSAEAFSECVRRLEAYFNRGEDETEH